MRVGRQCGGPWDIVCVLGCTELEDGTDVLVGVKLVVTKEVPEAVAVLVLGPFIAVYEGLVG